MVPRRRSDVPGRSPASAAQLLTRREREVLARIAEGRTSKEIASELGISLRTVNTHREHLAQKLGTSSVAAFVRYAIAHGLTDSTPQR
jgi:DNA-binding CsgD family transcriptional regulator